VVEYREAGIETTTVKASTGKAAEVAWIMMTKKISDQFSVITDQ